MLKRIGNSMALEGERDAAGQTRRKASAASAASAASLTSLSRLFSVCHGLIISCLSSGLPNRDFPSLPPPSCGWIDGRPQRRLASAPAPILGRRFIDPSFLYLDSAVIGRRGRGLWDRDPFCCGSPQDRHRIASAIFKGFSCESSEILVHRRESRRIAQGFLKIHIDDSKNPTGSIF